MTLTQISVEPPVRPIDEFIFNTPRMTLQGLKDATTETLGVVCATVKRILNPDCFWYTACVCNKFVIPDSNMFFCDKCNKHVLKVFPRYCMKVRVMDHTDSASLVIFDREASSLFNMSCADMLETNQRNVGPKVVPPEIVGLVEKTWLFKVETKPARNPRFEQTFKEVGSLSTLLGKGKDILICGSTNVLSEDLLSLTGSSSKSCGKVVDCDSTPGDFTQDLMNKFTDTVVNLASDSDGEELAAPVVIVDDDSVQEVHSTITENDYAASDAKGTKFNKDMTEANARGIEGTHMGGMHKGAKSGVVNVADDCAESKKEFVTPNQISSIEAKESKSKKAVKRVSPGKVDDYEDDNAPIKLLKRAIKIEK
ncbi:replication factor-A carboxy-terminal domain protein, partial [Trifolium pratense]